MKLYCLKVVEVVNLTLIEKFELFSWTAHDTVIEKHFTVPLRMNTQTIITTVI